MAVINKSKLCTNSPTERGMNQTKNNNSSETCSRMKRIRTPDERSITGLNCFFRQQSNLLLIRECLQKRSNFDCRWQILCQWCWFLSTGCNNRVFEWLCVLSNAFMNWQIQPTPKVVGYTGQFMNLFENTNNHSKTLYYPDCTTNNNI